MFIPQPSKKSTTPWRSLLSLLEEAGGYLWGLAEAAADGVYQHPALVFMLACVLWSMWR